MYTILADYRTQPVSTMNTVHDNYRTQADYNQRTAEWNAKHPDPALAMAQRIYNEAECIGRHRPEGINRIMVLLDEAHGRRFGAIVTTLKELCWANPPQHAIISVISVIRQEDRKEREDLKKQATELYVMDDWRSVNLESVRVVRQCLPPGWPTDIERWPVLPQLPPPSGLPSLNKEWTV